MRFSNHTRMYVLVHSALSMHQYMQNTRTFRTKAFTPIELSQSAMSDPSLSMAKPLYPPPGATIIADFDDGTRNGWRVGIETSLIMRSLHFVTGTPRVKHLLVSFGNGEDAFSPGGRLVEGQTRNSLPIFIVDETASPDGIEYIAASSTTANTAGTSVLHNNMTMTDKIVVNSVVDDLALGNFDQDGRRTFAGNNHDLLACCTCVDNHMRDNKHKYKVLK